MNFVIMHIDLGYSTEGYQMTSRSISPDFIKTRGGKVHIAQARRVPVGTPC